MQGYEQSSRHSCWVITFATNLILCSTLLSSSVSAGSNYPDQPVRIIVPYAPGGTGDVIARLIAKKISQDMREPVVVENRPGAAGSIGAAAVARAKPDGYTILLGYTSEMVINPIVQKDISYNVNRDFSPVALAGSTPLLLVANPDTGARSIDELVALANANPNKISYASAGLGSPAHIAGALLAKDAGIKMLHIPYKGGSQAVSDTVGGIVNIYFSGMPPAVPFVKNGKLLALGVASENPTAALPDVPALASGKYPRLNLVGWFGFFVPKSVPQHIQTILHEKISTALKAADISKQLLAQGVETTPFTASQFASFVDSEQAQYKKLIQELNIITE